MRGRQLAFALAMTLLGSAGLSQDMTAAKNDGKAFGQAQSAAAAGTADSQATPIAVLPNYNGANAPQTSYMSNPAALDADKFVIAATNEGYRLTADGSTTRPRIPTSEIDATLSRGRVIAGNPATYAGGLANGGSGQCVALPPSTVSTGSYEATCNTGVKISTETRSCAPALVPATTTQTFYDYWVSDDRFASNGVPVMAGFTAMIASRQCTALPQYLPVCDIQVVHGSGGGDVIAYLSFCRGGPLGHAQGQRYTCSSQVPDPFAGNQPFPAVATGQLYFATVSRSTTTVARNDSVCSALAGDSQCLQTAPEVCTSSDPQTRTMTDGTVITAPCWAWRRDYQCTAQVAANDCGAGTIPSGCTFARDECLDNPAPSDPSQCKVHEKFYTCPMTARSADRQYVCGGDVYCINGDCEPVVREASTEFKDALAGLHSLDQATKEFDPSNFTLFKGVSTGCHKPVFGLGNCCGGNGFPLIGTCTREEGILAGQIDKGETHYVGTYCSGDFLGICHTKRRTYCSFSSKLTRILQEQGRPQIGKSWGPTNNPDCSGFTIDQFAQLDLSRVDFSEIYNDFINAAQLPNEATALSDIQAKIADYYARIHH